MYGKMKDFLTKELADIREAGLYKEERIITTPQRADIEVKPEAEVLNFCANNYLGLSNNEQLIEGAVNAMKQRGYGMSSVRFICGTQDIHKQLEAAISDYFQTEDTILYSSCFDANGGLFEPLLGEGDAIISDALNHASIIDGVRLCKAKRYRYANANMEELEKCLQEAQAQRFRIIATDGVFSMDGNVAPMDKICELAEKYDAMVMVDESHSAGVVGLPVTVWQSNSTSMAKSTSSLAHSARHSVALWVVSPRVRRKLLTFCANALAHTCSATALLLALWVQASRLSAS